MAMVWTGFTSAKRAKWGTMRLPLCPTSLHALRITSHLERWLFSEGHDLQILSRFYALKARHDCTIYSPQSILAPLSSLQGDTVPPTPVYLRINQEFEHPSRQGQDFRLLESCLFPPFFFLLLCTRQVVNYTTRNYVTFGYCSETGNIK